MSNKPKTVAELKLDRKMVDANIAQKKIELEKLHLRRQLIDLQIAEEGGML